MFPSLLGTLVVAVGATLCADLVWYSLARWRGTKTLALIARFSATARGGVQRGQSLFPDHEGAFRLGARFLLNWVRSRRVGLGHLEGQAVTEAALHLRLRVMLVVL